MEFRIERAQKEDLGAILRVMRPWNMHHVPSPEMEELDLDCFFIAKINAEIVGAAGYKILSQTRGKTTLLGVLPKYQGLKIGRALQDARLEAMHQLGVKWVTTNADLPASIHWYKKHYGYQEIGRLKKISDFGDSQIDYWTTLELNLSEYMQKKELFKFEQHYLAGNEPHPLAPYPPLIINVCLTGMIPTKTMTPNVPVTPEEIISDAIRVFDAGARIVHLHARDENGHPTWKAEIYEKIIIGIRQERPQLICCVSTSGRNWPEFEHRSEVLQINGKGKPDMASLTLSSLNFPTGASVNEPEIIKKLAATMSEKNIKPELEVFDLGMVGFAKYLERKGIIRSPKYFNILLGNLSSAAASIHNLSAIVHELPPDSTWAIAGIGMFQLPMNVAGIIAGGSIRIGIEDNIYLNYSEKALATNLQLVNRIVDIADRCQRPIATPSETRHMLGLS